MSASHTSWTVVASITLVCALWGQDAQDAQEAPPAIVAAAVLPDDTPARTDADRSGLEAARRVIELAICLDTSGSMDGLIDSARQKLWTIVNDLAAAEPTPRLRVALLSYGNDGHHPENGWVEVETPFTEDLDTVSQRLFALTTNGGTELVGRVIQTSLEELDWNAADDALRMVFVAGNESAEQDERVAARAISAEAAARGIDVNSIYCVYGDDSSEIRSGWREFAGSGNGEFAMIDQDNGTVVIATPYDAELVELSAALNETYIPFGEQGEAGCSNQAAQDANAAGLSFSSAAARAATKAGKLYSCGSWDLVDAIRTGEVTLAEVADEDLPEDMRSMTRAERMEHIKSKQSRRSELQGRIGDLDRRRQALLDRELARQATTDVGSLDLAIRGAVRTRAEAKGFAFAALGAPMAAATAAPVEAVPSLLAPMESFDYFVRVGGSDTWVASDLIGEYEDAVRGGGSYTHDHHVSPGTPEAAELVEALPSHVRQLVGDLTGMLYLRFDGDVYVVTGGC